jgi:hypothetical protein
MAADDDKKEGGATTASKDKKAEAGGQGDNDDNEGQSRVVDPRIYWFEEPVTKALKIKSDKWKKMTSHQESW